MEVIIGALQSVSHGELPVSQRYFSLVSRPGTRLHTDIHAQLPVRGSAGCLIKANGLLTGVALAMNGKDSSTQIVSQYFQLSFIWTVIIRPSCIHVRYGYGNND